MRLLDDLIVQALAELPEWLPSVVIPRLEGYPDPRSCWEWRGHLTGGYGRTTIPRRLAGRVAQPLVHRVMWISLRGPISGGLELDHGGDGCGNRRCANPAHLSLVTHYVNTVVTGSSFAAINSRKQTCPRGHPLTEGNLVKYFEKMGRRSCLVCSRERARAFRSYDASEWPEKG